MGAGPAGAPPAGRGRSTGFSGAVRDPSRGIAPLPRKTAGAGLGRIPGLWDYIRSQTETKTRPAAKESALRHAAKADRRATGTSCVNGRKPA
jgi:hypothetical protein